MWVRATSSWPCARPAGRSAAAYSLEELAKAGKPIVKEFEDEFFVRHALVLDTFTGDPRNELFEEAVSVAASFACAVLNQESLLDLLFVESKAYCFTAGRGLSHTEQILEILAAVQPSGPEWGAARLRIWCWITRGW